MAELNIDRWRNPNVPIELLALKLCEEAAEVGTEITDARMKKQKIQSGPILVELEHVRMLSNILRDRILGGA